MGNQIGEGEKICDQLIHPDGAVHDEFEKPHGLSIEFFTMVLVDDLREAPDGSHGRAEVVGNGIGEGFELPVGLFQLPRPLADPRLELFVRAADGFLGFLAR